MSRLPPTTAQIRAQLEAVLKRQADARVIGVHSPARRDWPAALHCSARDFRLRWCASALEAREALAEWEADGDAGLVLLTDVEERALGDDLVARLARGRVFRIGAWDMLREAFQARELDARLSGQEWLAEMLLDLAPAGGYPPVSGGVLDAETAWRHLLDRTLGLEALRPDPMVLLSWSMGEEAARRFDALEEQVRVQIAAWLAAAMPPAGHLLGACMSAGHVADLLPLGLIAQVVFGGEAADHPDVQAAPVRLERYTGGVRLEAQAGRRWGEAASIVAGNAAPGRLRRALDRADALLEALHLGEVAATSDLLLAGFEARLAQFGAALAEALERPGSDLAPLDRAARRVLAHRQAGQQRSRARRVTMASRLLRWLRVASPPPSAMAPIARWYADEGGFVDWARNGLRGGDEQQALSSAYTRLLEAVRAQREGINRRFGEAYAAWNGASGEPPSAIPVERVLDALLAPLARARPVLLLVMDGLSFAVYRELAEDLEPLGWLELCPEGEETPPPALAVVPTVTRVSRASLLCGRLTRADGQSQERAGFVGHPGLRAVTRGKQAPVLIHKGELTEDGALAPGVRAALSDPTQRVVGIVYNAVDDHLDGPDQVHPRWSLDDLRLLRPIFHEARNGGRAVVVTADHGHVQEAGSEQRPFPDGDRWRRADGAPEQDEVLVAGGRALTVEGEPRALVPWSEQRRYGPKKTGYHGGVSPQEVVVPLAVLVPGEAAIEGWREAPPAVPEWWEPGGELLPPQPPPPPPRRAPTSRATPNKGATADLFAAPQAAAATPAMASAPWIDALLASDTYASQKRLAARVAPADADVRAALEALEARGGRLSRVALAKKLGKPLMRVGGLVSALRRVLNVDQSPVLSLDEASGELVLDRALLVRQFELAEAP